MNTASNILKATLDAVDNVDSEVTEDAIEYIAYNPTRNEIYDTVRDIISNTDMVIIWGATRGAVRDATDDVTEDATWTAVKDVMYNIHQLTPK